jgi:methionyl aminopeptidase
MLRPIRPTSNDTTTRLAGRGVRVGAIGTNEPVALRTADEIERIGAAGRVVAQALEAARLACVPGVTTREVAAAAERVLLDEGATPVFRGRLDDVSGVPFPAAATVSVEDVVLHGMPGDRRILDGELVSIDCAARLDGWHADAAITVEVGRVDATRARLATAVQDLLDTAIDLVRPGIRWSRIATILQEVAFDSGYGLVEGFTGHGIGRDLHESPAVPASLTAGLRGRGDFTLRPGMVLAIEPVLVAAGSISGPARRADGTAAGVPLVLDEDGWSIRTLDGAVAAHAEHTIAVGRRGAVVLTDSNRRTLSQVLASEECAD